jgi:endoglycosylceramidase
VFVEAPNQASLGIRSWLGHVEGGHIAFFPHLYDPSIETATYTPGGTVQFDPKFHGTYASVIDIYPRRFTVPVLFGEWGVAHPEAPGMAEYVRRTLDLMEEHGTGWTQFQGCRGSGYCAFGPNGEDRPGIGQITQPWATAVDGEPIRMHWDRTTRQLYVGYTNRSIVGTTDLVVPASRVYPGGWKIETSDPDGTWSYETTGAGTDAEPLVVSVTAGPGSGKHAICLKPAGAPDGCEVPPDAPGFPDFTPPPTTVPSGGVAPASGAQPVRGAADFTG